MNDWVDAGNNASINVANKITYSAWVKITSSDGNYSSFMSKSPKTACFLMQRDNSKSITFGCYLGISGYKETSIGDADISLDVWYHITGTYDGVMKIYLNGVFKSQDTTGSGIIPQTTQSFLVGASTLSGERWPGYVDDVRVYNRALSAEEIKAIYDTTK